MLQIPQSTNSTVAMARWLRIGGGLYVAAWLIGLLIAPTGPPSGASFAEVHGYYVAHRLPVLGQSLLVHGLAGVALAIVVFTLRLRRRLERRTGGLETAALFAGVVAAGLSIVQVVVLVVLVSQVEATVASRTAELRNAIDLLDSAKLVALGLLVAGTTSPLLTGRRRLRALGRLLTPALWAGALSFLIDAPALTVALYVSLPLLLAWVLGVALVPSPAAMRGALTAEEGDLAAPATA